MGRLLLCLVLAGFARPAVACLNDNELPSHEREFRSQYLASHDFAPRPPDSDSPGHWFLMYGGAVLLAGALTVAYRVRPRS